MMFGVGAGGRVTALMLIASGLLLLGFAARNAVTTYSFVRRAVRADGTVIALNAGGAHPQIRFITPDEQVISYAQGGLIFGYKPGDAVRVLFDAMDPGGTATIDAFGAVWFNTLLLGVLGTIVISTGLSNVISFGPRQ
jgi:hypothetical protein